VWSNAAACEVLETTADKQERNHNPDVAAQTESPAVVG